MQRPPVLFLDEPTTGLDLQSRNELWRMIRELVDDGTTVLLTTQYLEEADRLADRIVVIDGGKVIANDTPLDLKTRLGATVVELGMGGEAEAQRAQGLVARFVTIPPEVEGDMVRLTSNDGSEILVDVLRALDAERLSPVSLAVREPSLDDVFLKLTGHHAESDDASADAAPDAKGKR
jgi:ABC-type multidrug transport system ATPase subunit